jgi:hypothetical protein
VEHGRQAPRFDDVNGPASGRFEYNERSPVSDALTTLVLGRGLFQRWSWIDSNPRVARVALLSWTGEEDGVSALRITNIELSQLAQRIFLVSFDRTSPSCSFNLCRNRLPKEAGSKEPLFSASGTVIHPP